MMAWKLEANFKQSSATREAHKQGKADNSLSGILLEGPNVRDEGAKLTPRELPQSGR